MLGGRKMNSFRHYIPGAGLVLLLALFPLPARGQGKPEKFEVSPLEKEVLDLTNKERAKMELPPLKPNAKLFYAARFHSKNMAATKQFNHIIDGKSPIDRAKAYEYPSPFVGENIAGGAPTPELALKLWMNSQGHRENILKAQYKEIGIGVYRLGNGPLFWTQVFGSSKEGDNPPELTVGKTLILEPPPMKAGAGNPNQGAGAGTEKDEAKKAFEYLNQVRANPPAHSPEIGVDLSAVKPIKALKWNAILAKVAEEKAADMAKRDYFSHTTPEGLGINYLMNQAGYKLPPALLKTKDANFFESIAAGKKSGKEIIQMLILDKDTPGFGHRKHLLGMEKFYADCTDMGVGIASNPQSKFKTYACIIVAHPPLQSTSTNEAANSPTQTEPVLPPFSREDQLTKSDTEDPLLKGRHSKIFLVRLMAGKNYTIDLSSKQFASYLFLKDDKGKIIVHDDGNGSQRAQVSFEAKMSGTYRVVVTSLQAGATRAFLLQVK